MAANSKTSAPKPPKQIINIFFQTALFETIPIITNYKNITKAADPQWGRIKTDK